MVKAEGMGTLTFEMGNLSIEAKKVFKGWLRMSIVQTKVWT